MLNSRTPIQRTALRSLRRLLRRKPLRSFFKSRSGSGRGRAKLDIQLLYLHFGCDVEATEQHVRPLRALTASVSPPDTRLLHVLLAHHERIQCSSEATQAGQIT